MRPLELTLEGFKSHRHAATFDWRGRRLVGIVGPIGAGKSSVLDAMAFALYGKTPVVERDTRSLIHQLCDTCHVELRFEVDDQVWRVVRGIRRKGQSGHKLERLESDGTDPEVVEIITGEAAVRDRVEQLLGLDFHGFCRSVLLAQNQFAEFLRATPAERDKVLKGVFGYERLDEALRVAKSRFGRADSDLEVLEERAREAEDARTRLEAVKEEETRAAARLSELQAAKPVADQLHADAEAARRERDDAAARDRDVTEVASAMPRREEVTSAVEASAGARSVLAAAKAELDRAEETRRRAEADLRETEGRVGDRDRFRTFADVVRRHEAEAKAVLEERGRVAEASAQLDGARTAAEQADEALGAATSARETATTALDAATTQREAADATLLEARHAEMALELRAVLAIDAPCPVCRQPVHALPRRGAAPKVAAAERAAAKAVRAEEAARAEREQRATALAGAESALRAAHAAVEARVEEHRRASHRASDAETALAATKAELIEWLGEGDPTELLQVREAELRDVEARLTQAEAGVREARSEHDAAREVSDVAGATLATLATRLAGAWGRAGQRRDVEPAPESVSTGFLELAEFLVQRHEDEMTAIADAEARIRATVADLAELLEGVGLAADADLQQELVRAGVAHGSLKQRAGDLAAKAKGAARVRKKIAQAREQLDLARRLTRDLQPSRFLAFLLEEERAELGAVGSEHFEELTDGAYRFADDAFDVVDLNAAGARRRAESLSGGETFLASLALALALAEMVSRGGGRLDAFFLDEGFGSLDPEHLDRAMDGIGKLVADDGKRLVVLVSHVAEMREAVEDLVVLDKDAVTGDTLVVSGAGPL